MNAIISGGFQLKYLNCKSLIKLQFPHICTHFKLDIIRTSKFSKMHRPLTLKRNYTYWNNIRKRAARI